MTQALNQRISEGDLGARLLGATGLMAMLAAASTAQAIMIADYSADAGNPASPAAIESPADQGWTESGTGAGVTVEGVVHGGTNAWRINDDAANLNAVYERSLSPADLASMYRGGWEFTLVVRTVRDAGTAAGFCGWGVSPGNDPGWGLVEQERVGFWMEHVSADDAFQVTPEGGTPITLAPGSATNFHTIRCVGSAFSSQYEFFLDGVSRGMLDISDGISNSNFDERVRFASGSTGGVGREAFWNRVRLEAGQPVFADYQADAGNPAGAMDIESPVDQGWAESGSGGGVIVEGVVEGGTNAWRISDDDSGANPAYDHPLSASDFAAMYQYGWELTLTMRAVRDPGNGAGFCGWGVSTGNDPGWGLTDQERVGFSVERVAGTDAFQVSPTHGGSVTLADGSATNFHTIRCLGSPASSQYEFYVDDVFQGVFDIKEGSSNNNYDNRVRVASGSTGGTGREAHWHSVSLKGLVQRLIVKPVGGLVVGEQGPTSDTFTVELDRLPVADVIVSVTPQGDTTELDFGQGPGVATNLLFTPGAWDAPQEVTVTAVDDTLEQGDRQRLIELSAASGDPYFDGAQASLPVTVLDDDIVNVPIDVTAEVFISPKGSFVSDPASYHTFRIPSLLVAPDGSLLAFAEGRRGTGSDPRTQTNAPIDIVMKRSTDNGMTWGPLQVIDPGYQSNGWQVDFGDPTTVVDETTDPPTIVLFYGHWTDYGPINPLPGNDPDPAAVNQVVWCRTSTNNGVNWSERSQVIYPVGPTENPISPDGLYWRYANPGPGNGIQLKWQEGPNAALNGRLIIPAKRSGSSTPTGSTTVEPMMFYSDDHGLTWQIGNVTAGPNANEDEVVELINGQVLLDARQNSGSFRRRHLSDDGGVNWGGDLGDDVPITAVDCSLDRYSARREGDDRDRILFSGPAGNPLGSGSGRYNLAVWTSYDEGASFINPVQVNEGFAAYSVVRRLPDGRIAAFVETASDGGATYGKIEYFGFGLEYLEGMRHPREVTHYDGFGNTIVRARGGMGWSGPWSGSATFTGMYAPELGSSSVVLADFDRPRLPGRLDLVGGQSAERWLSRPLDLGVSGCSYVSLLVSRQLDGTADGEIDEELRVELRDAGGATHVAFGVDSTEAFFLDQLGALQQGAAGELSLTNSYLLVLKIVASSGGADQLFLKAYPSGGYGSGSVESDLGWTLVGDDSQGSSAVLERIALSGGLDAVWSVDEIRIGETWGAVAGEDVDADALEDAWEIKWFANLTTSDGSGDSDGDGLTDAEEQAVGTDPTSALSVFRAILQEAGGGLTLSWPSVEHGLYRVESRSHLTAGSWTELQGSIPGSPPLDVFPLNPTGQSQYYRVVVE